MTKIHAPNKRYTGIVAGVSFIDGVAETDNEYLIGWFDEKGYEVIREEDTAADLDDKEDAEEAVRKELEELTVPELKKRASDAKIEGYSDMKKDKLIQAIIDLK